jgi:hypothetical protein
MFPETCDEVTLISGASPRTITVSASAATFIVTAGTVALAPTSSSNSSISAVAKPGSSIRSR